MRSSRLYRCFALMSAFLLVFVSLAITPQVRTTAAQEGALTLGDAPLMGDVGLASVTPASTPVITTSASVDPSTREASRAFYAAYFSGSTPAIGWTGSFASCTPGTTSVAFQTAVLNRIAYYRAMAGVPANIGLSQEGNELAQHAALMMGKAGRLSHDPGPDWPCYSQTGADGAGSSNLGIGTNGPDAISGYMFDPGANNTSVGHRRWILYPRTQLFGTGDVPNANALWVFGYRGSEPPTTTTRDGFVAWPNRGYVPYQVVPSRWSFSYPGAYFGEASVTVTLAGRSIPVRLEPLAGGYGDNTIVWTATGDELRGWDTADDGIDRRFTVTVSNVVINGTPQTFTYDVIIFDPASEASAGAFVSPARATVNSSISYSLAGYPANANVRITWKRLSGSTIDMGTTRTDASGNATGQIRVPATPGGPGQEILFSSGSVSRTVRFEVAPRIKVLTDPAVRGEEVNVSLRGYDRQEVVRIRWKQGNSWVELDRVTTSNTGSANAMVTIPDWAADGNNSVRGDGTSFSQQTNAVFVQGTGEPEPPAANAGPDQSVQTTGATANVTLDGSGSSAPDGTISDYVWTSGSSELATGVSPEVSLPVGTHTITLTVTDSNGLTGSDTVVITVIQTTGTPTVTITPDRTTVNNWITYTIEGYPANSTVQITWKRLSGSTIDIATTQTDAGGFATGRFRVPATPGGPDQEITFSSGGIAETVLFEVAPRIKVLTDPGVRGEEVNVSLRGYERREEVRIRWRQPDDTWVEVARVTTSNTGSANVMVTVPEWAPDGNNSVRGDGSIFRQQTNVVFIEGGEFQPAGEASPTPSPTETATPTVTETPADPPTETPIPSETAIPTEMPAPSETPTVTETPVETETAVPTATATEEPPPSETATGEAEAPVDGQ